MLLKKIEFQGFKSFVDPTTLSFEPGISAIVGPNGCGKSNVSDAIRWVLGEQSAKALRGSKMVDVIFNGTDHRKPSGLAEVSLTISNEDRKLPIDFAEVTVTRRAYRSGENEYLLNKGICRLKDIHSLFADTGVGTDGYSLLEQGKMDLILSAKAVERRSVFEEAAGITGYKAQRDEALRKMEATEQNLLRVNDIVQEVKRQINSLERQARRAEKYQTLKSELDQLESRFLSREFKIAAKRQHELENEMRSLRERMDSLETEISSGEAKLTETRFVLSHDEEALSKSTAAVHALESEKAELDKQIEINRKEIIFLGERAQRALDESRQARERQAQSESDAARMIAELEKEKAELEGLKAALGDIETRSREASRQRRDQADEAQRLQQQSLELINRRSSVKAEIESFHGRNVQLEARMQQLRGELQEAQDALNEAGQKLEDAQQKVGGKREEARGLEEGLMAKYQRKRELEEALRMADEALSGAQVVFSSHKARLTVLDELSKALEGFEDGPKALLMESQKGTGLPLLESLAHRVRTRPEYELAVEMGLGHRLQTLVAASQGDGLKALAWLREQKQGRASVLAPQETLAESAGFSGELLKRNGVLGVLSDYLESDANLAPVLKWLGGRQLLVKDLDVALSLRGQLPAATEAVTLEGIIVSAEGIITGGSTEGAARGLLTRERELGELKGRIQAAETQVQERQVDRDRLRGELKQVSDEIERHAADLQSTQIQVAQLQKEHSSKIEDQERLTRQSEEKRKAIETSEVESAGYRARSESLDRELATMLAHEARLHESMEAALAASAKAREEEENLQNRLSETRVREASLGQQVSHLESNLERLKAEIGRDAEQAARLEEESRRAGRDQESLSRKNEEWELRLQQLFARADEARAKVVQCSEQRQAHQDQLAGLERGLRDIRSRVAEAAEERHTREMSLQESRLRAGQLKERLFKEYMIQIDETQGEQMALEPDATPEAAPEDLSQEKVEELKHKIEELGVVNPAAAEEYRELEQRHSMLVGQLEDLRSAKLDVQKVIGRINDESRERFLKTFDAVHENFKRIFKTLFGGGEAKLILLEDADLLEAGIDIIARPPGKRQQSISLLSGGEKALTATALLFALFECKPSPFCVLDEIDAPLDDANISRFTKLLTEYAKASQFIVITHSKITMEKADVLYGVTMEEAGVSKIVSAKFKEDQPVVID